MKITFNGKSPKKRWYAWQKTKGIFKSFGKRDGKAQTRNAALKTAATAGAAWGTKFLYATVVMSPVFLPSLLGWAAIATTGFLGVAAFKSTRNIGRTKSVRDYISGQERKWYNRKTAKANKQRAKQEKREAKIEAKAEKTANKLAEKSMKKGFNAANTNAAALPEKKAARANKNKNTL